MVTGGVLVIVGFASFGGVLFGLDQGNWGGAIVKEPFVRDFCDGSYEECSDADSLPNAYVSFLALGSSLVQFGAALGALTIGPWVAWHGRRRTLFIGSIIAVIGNVGQVFVMDKAWFLVSRFFDGVGVGLVTYALPMFVSELAPPSIRGALGCMMQLTMVIGMVVASVLNCAPWFSYQVSFSLPIYPALVLAVGIVCLPISPRFVIMKWRRLGNIQKGVEQARASLQIIRASSEAVEEELAELQGAITGAVDDAPWNALWRDKSIFRRVLVANMLQWLQQFSGVNAILSYGPSIFHSAGIALDGLVCTAIVSSINLVFTIVMILAIDRLGRRALLLLGAVGMFVFMSLASALTFALEFVDAGSPGRAILGYMLLSCICGYMASFAVGWGGTPWVYPSEIFPMSLKEKALSTSVCSQWIANFLIAFLVPLQVKILKVHGTFLFYAFCLASCIYLVYKFVPETKGKTEDQIDRLFRAEVEIPTSIHSRASEYAADDLLAELQTK